MIDPENMLNEIKFLESERDRLKAELRKSVVLAEQNRHDRDLWKSKAEKLAEAGNFLVRRIDPNMFQKQINEWNTALAEFEKGV